MRNGRRRRKFGAAKNLSEAFLQTGGGGYRYTKGRSSAIHIKEAQAKSEKERRRKIN